MLFVKSMVKVIKQQIEKTLQERENAMEGVICLKCKRKLRNINAWYYCQEVDIDDLFLNKSDDIVLAFDRRCQAGKR